MSTANSIRMKAVTSPVTEHHCRPQKSTTIPDKGIYWWSDQGKLIFIDEPATPDFWDRRWETEDWVNEVTHSRGARRQRHLLEKYVPDTDSWILEAGCGTGHFVDAMAHWGYRATGVDFAPDTVAKTKAACPNLDIRIGDVRSLDFEDDALDGCWSLGLIEHFWTGYDDILEEMYRVLKPGAYAFVGFPCIAPLDRLKILMRGYRRLPPMSEEPEGFYQFALDARAVQEDLKTVGFEVVGRVRRNVEEGVHRLSPTLGRAFSHLLRLDRQFRPLRVLTYAMEWLLLPWCGYSIRLIARKPA